MHENFLCIEHEMLNGTLEHTQVQFMKPCDFFLQSFIRNGAAEEESSTLRLILKLTKESEYSEQV